MIAVMAIQCGLVAAGALGILMLIILPGHVYLLGEPFVVRQFTDGGQHAYYEHDRSKMLISYDRRQ